MSVNNIEIKIRDNKKYSEYSQTEKEIFEAYRDSMLMIFPTNEDGKSFPDETIDVVEKTAFVFVDKFPEKVKNPPTIAQIVLAVTAAMPAPTTTESSTPK